MKKIKIIKTRIMAVFMAIAMVAGVVVPFIDLIGACAGLITFHIGMHALRFFIFKDVQETLTQKTN